MPIFFLVIFLPLAEILGLILIGGKIGAGLSLLWVIADVFIGFTLLTTPGRHAEHESLTPAEKLFDDICIIVGALLLIFPGFISDFLALPILIPPVRHAIFLFLRHKHGNILNDIEKSSQQFARWQHFQQGDSKSSVKTIEGDFRKVDENERR